MKRVIIALLMLFFAVSVSFISSCCIDKYISELIYSTENLYDKPNNEKISKLIPDWERLKPFLKYISKHEEINEIDLLFIKLETAITDESIREICLEIEALLDNFKKSETASFENIF